MIRAYAFEVRETGTGTLRGVGVAVPADRYVAFRAVGTEYASRPALSDEAWEELTQWAQAGDADLPKQPPAISSRIVSAVMQNADTSKLVAKRVADIPVAETVGRMLLGGTTR